MASYGQEVWNLAYLLTRKHEMADDITQDVFLKAHANIRAFRGDSSIKTWLLTITRNLAINSLRTAFMRKVTLVAWVMPQGAGPSAEQEAMDNEWTSRVWLNVLKLPVKLREVLVLHAKYEMSTKDIAKMLQLSEGTVKSRLSRARSKMSEYRRESEEYE
ncbi:RNA polymerase sigma factor [Cohnella faecalis]|uniref:RNA polymerase sigma factor n=2 Tax=Cohnella faecalis TaxID=2315694 RepID=A0A398CUZ6_9BACL|nr:RNA polymerase sigma factor [Cohnella faecalis]